MIQILDTSKGQKAVVSVKGKWFALYRKAGKIRRRALRTKNEKDALKFRDQFYSDLLADGATVYSGRQAHDKVQDKPDLYVYERPPYEFKVGGKVLLASWDKDEVIAARDKWIAENG